MAEGAPSLNLLIVEDEALIAMTIEDALLSYGHTVVGIADTVASARDLAERHTIDLALCDVRLAHGDSGIDAAHRLAEQGIVVVYLSGNCPPCSSAPLVIGCISKPFSVAALHSTVMAAHQIAKGEGLIEAPPTLNLYS